MTEVPVLLTCDIHTHTAGAEQVDRDLQSARQILRETRLPCTFFFPAESAEMLRGQVDGLRREGHEIGCHGLTHDPSEIYSRLPVSRQERFLQQATERLSRLLEEPPISFRAPAFKVSGQTMRILEGLGYRADLSVNSQRLGALGSDITNLAPLWAPRLPYHPSWSNPYRKGNGRLWEIPVSAWILPFVSNSERLLGLGFMRWFFRVLHGESRLTGKPIVFVFHAEDLNAQRGRQRKAQWSWKYLRPSQTYGFEFRYLLFEHDWRRVQEDQVALFRTMAAFPDIRFLTVRDYLESLKCYNRGHPAQSQTDAYSKTIPAHLRAAPVAGRTLLGLGMGGGSLGPNDSASPGPTR